MRLFSVKKPTKGEVASLSVTKAGKVGRAFRVVFYLLSKYINI